MPYWATFAGVTIVVLLLLLALTHLTQRAFSADDGSSKHQATAETNSNEPTADRRFESDADQRFESPADQRFESPADQQPPPSADRSTSAEDGAALTDKQRAEASRESAAVPDEHERRATTAHGREAAAEHDRKTAVERDRETAVEASVDPEELSTGALLANVALSQGLFAGVLIGAAIYAGIPASALGVEFSWPYLVSGILVGTAVGIGLYVANEIGAASATRFGFDHDEELRELLAPDSVTGWAILLVGVLPVIALFEELLFRAALIGALSVGFGVDPWLLAVVSSIAFGLGHGMQGRVGIAVTAGLGFVLAAVFILTESLLVVVVAHYLINAFEFVVHERLGFDWAEIIES